MSYQLGADDGYINHLIFSFLGDSPLTQSIVAIVLIFFQATFINYIVNKNRIASQPNLLPGIAYVVFVSLLPSFQVLNPILISITLLLFAINSLFQCASKFANAGQIFSVSFFISLASFIYFPCWVFLFAGYISLVSIRSFKVRERIQYLLGAVVPYYLFSSYFNWYAVLGEYMSSYLSQNVVLPNLTGGFSYYQIGVITGFIFLVFFSFFKYNDYRKKKTVATQKKIDILYWLLLFTLPMLFFWKNMDLQHFLILVPSLSILFGMFFFSLKNRFLAETIHGLTIIMIWFTQFQFAGL